MVMETQAANVMGGKTARACDACMRRRAHWFCAADDAFLCQTCDSSIHSANQLAIRHERVRLRTCSMSPSSSFSSSVHSQIEKSTGVNAGTLVWYEGFTRKTRTPRRLLRRSLQKKKVVNAIANDDLDFDLDLNSTSNSNEPVVPELGSEEELFLFPSMVENEENLNCQVPVFDFSDMEMEANDINKDENSFGFAPDSDKIGGGCHEEEQMENGLNGFLPFDMDLAELTMDVESLLGEESCMGIKEPGALEFKEDEEKIGLTLRTVKDEEEEEGLGETCRWNLDNGSSVSGGKREEVEDVNGKKGLRSEDNYEEEGEEEERCADEKAKKQSLFLRLDYEAVMIAWDSECSPWTTGRCPDFRPSNFWLDCLGFVIDGSEEATPAVGSMPRRQGRGGSDGEREARVLRYREKRRRRLFAKKIRYEVRKLNAEKRPRIKGRFVRRTSSYCVI
ncbi:PREDICTED: zinc finger protein CONSTANS-LIKE 7 isoform X2 [Tarenaya hassleriana]|uniref:zinc finger protein CONSTANS-LIKE 7 isoform X2 n=1 Tax=Tarenaya hassleriana TaxID=28532 RepID=UPI00053C3894|nr:PREDICTED: zinc finger protein CONSTANS-LIKE 7 isoform X2 [Tarenaya hassleriana]